MDIKYVASSTAVDPDLRIVAGRIQNSRIGLEISYEHLNDYMDLPLQPYSVHMPIDNMHLTHYDPLLRQDSILRVRSELEKAHSRNVRLAVMHIEGGHATAPPVGIGAKMRNFMRSASAIFPFARELGISIALENNGFRRDAFSDPSEILSLVASLAKRYPNIGVCFDVGHANVYARQSGKSLLDIFNTLRDYVIHFHLHENRGDTDDHLPLTGLIHESFYKEILKTKPSAFIFETKGSMGLKGIKQSRYFLRRLLREG